jgi:hypothetical protein
MKLNGGGWLFAVVGAGAAAGVAVVLGARPEKIGAAIVGGLVLGAFIGNPLWDQRRARAKARAISKCGEHQWDAVPELGEHMYRCVMCGAEGRRAPAA